MWMQIARIKSNVNECDVGDVSKVLGNVGFGVINSDRVGFMGPGESWGILHRKEAGIWMESWNMSNFEAGQEGWYYSWSWFQRSQQCQDSNYEPETSSTPEALEQHWESCSPAMASWGGGTRLNSCLNDDSAPFQILAFFLFLHSTGGPAHN